MAGIHCSDTEQVVPNNLHIWNFHLDLFVFIWQCIVKENWQYLYEILPKYLVGSATVAPRDPKIIPAMYKPATLRLPSHPGWDISSGIPKIN